MPSNMTYDANGNPEWGAYKAEKRAERFREKQKFNKVVNTLSNRNSHIYKNNRMSDQNLAKNYKQNLIMKEQEQSTKSLRDLRSLIKNRKL